MPGPAPPRFDGAVQSIHAVDDVPVVEELALARTTLDREKTAESERQLMPKMLWIKARISPRVVSKSVDSLNALRSARLLAARFRNPRSTPEQHHQQHRRHREDCLPQVRRS